MLDFRSFPDERKPSAPTSVIFRNDARVISNYLRAKTSADGPAQDRLPAQERGWGVQVWRARLPRRTGSERVAKGTAAERNTIAYNIYPVYTENKKRRPVRFVTFPECGTLGTDVQLPLPINTISTRSSRVAACQKRAVCELLARYAGDMLVNRTNSIITFMENVRKSLLLPQSLSLCSRLATG